MAEIRMVDLVGQYQEIKEELREAFDSILNNASFINGNEVKEFAREFEEYLGVKHVIPCANGTDALQIALMALNLPAGSEVICPSFTFVATAEVISLLGLKPVFVDVDPDTFNLNMASVEASISRDTKVIIPVHLYGLPVDMDPLLALAKEKGLKIVEDTAQGIGADIVLNGEHRKVGTIGDIGCTSFFPSKNLGAYGDGGAIMTNDDMLAEKMRKIVNHGMEKRYYHDLVGVNSRLDTLQAAVLRIKLRKLDTYNSNRNAAAEYYTEAFSSVDELICPTIPSDRKHVFHQYTLRVKNGKRDALKQHMDDLGIPAMIYYPVPLHEQTPYRRERISPHGLPITRTLKDEVISLPMHTELTGSQLKEITEAVKKFFN